MKATLRDLVTQAIDALRAAGTLPADLDTPDFVIERPKSRAQGDFSTNAAMLLAKPAKSNPRAIAQALVDALPKSDDIAKVFVKRKEVVRFTLIALPLLFHDALARTHLARGHRSRKVPRRGQQRHTNWLARHEQPIRTRRRATVVAVDSYCLFTEPAKEFGRIGDFGFRISEHFAVFANNQLRKCVVLCDHQIKGFAQDFCARTWSSGAPRRKCSVGCIDSI